MFRGHCPGDHSAHFQYQCPCFRHFLPGYPGCHPGRCLGRYRMRPRRKAEVASWVARWAGLAGQWAERWAQQWPRRLARPRGSLTQKVPSWVLRRAAAGPKAPSSAERWVQSRAGHWAALTAQLLVQPSVLLSAPQRAQSWAQESAPLPHSLSASGSLSKHCLIHPLQ